jgi:hypothetical protein
VFVWLGDGDGVRVAVFTDPGVNVGVRVTVCVGLTVWLGVDVAVRVVVGLGVAVGVADWLAVDVAVRVAVRVGVAVWLGVGVIVRVGVAVRIAVGLGVAVGVPPAGRAWPELGSIISDDSSTASNAEPGTRRNWWR